MVRARRQHNTRHHTLPLHTAHRKPHRLSERVRRDGRERRGTRPRAGAPPARRRARRHITHHHNTLLETETQRGGEDTHKETAHTERRSRAEDTGGKHTRIPREHPLPPRHATGETPALPGEMLRTERAHDKAAARHGSADKTRQHRHHQHSASRRQRHGHAGCQCLQHHTLSTRRHSPAAQRERHKSEDNTPRRDNDDSRPKPPLQHIPQSHRQRHSIRHRSRHSDNKGLERPGWSRHPDNKGGLERPGWSL